MASPKLAKPQARVKDACIPHMEELCTSSSGYIQSLTSSKNLFQSLSQSIRTQTPSNSNRTFYPLTPNDRSELERAHNTAEDWQYVVKLTDESVDAARIRNCSFYGYNAIGSFKGFCTLSESGPAIPSGCYDSVISNCVIGTDALVKDTLVLHRTIVQTKAVIVRCGCVDTIDAADTSSQSLKSFGNGVNVVIGTETGGRSAVILANLSFELASAVSNRRGKVDEGFQDAWKRQSNQYLDCIHSCEPMNYVGENAKILFCNRVRGCYIGEHAHIEDSVLRNSTILSSNEKKSRVVGKVLVEDSIIQHSVSLKSMCIVQKSLLCENASVDQQAIVKDSIIGPGTSIAEGEVTSSLVGPLVGFHHQSLLISTIWPQGRGNVAYGANIGSNHTVRLPDQELFPGEGMFFGLGVNVKFPSNFIRAPYSVLASGISTLPQCMEYPFSLVNTPRCSVPGLSPALNEVMPGWLLKSSIFTVLRNEIKFKSRLGTSILTHEILRNRPDIVTCMKAARTSLQNVQHSSFQTASNEAVYTKAEVRGLGSNYMTETSRISGIETYTYFIRLSALETLLQRFVDQRKFFHHHMTIGETIAAVKQSEVNPSDQEMLETLQDEYEDHIHVLICFDELIQKREELVKRAAQEIQRDENRGCPITPAYAAVHTPADRNSVIQAAHSNVEAIKKHISTLLEDDEL